MFTIYTVFTPAQLLNGVGLWKQRGNQDAELYQVEVTAPLDRSFDEDIGGDDDDVPGPVSSVESDDELCAAVYKVQSSSKVAWMCI
jgi:hypothetical protein